MPIFGANMLILQNNYTKMVVTCPHCQSLLQLTAKDIQGGDVCEFFYKCAACGKKADLQSRKIPPQIMKELGQ